MPDAPTDQTHNLLNELFKDQAERFTLSNGLTVIYKHEPANKLISIQVWVKTGSIHEKLKTGCGLSHFLEHMLFKGTEKRTARQINLEVEESGGYINAYTSFDRTVYYVDFPSEAFEKGMDILSDITLHSVLPSEEIEKERDVILREIDMGLDDPDRSVSRSLFRNAFKKHPYRQPVIGHRVNFQTITEGELNHYYKTRYVPNNMVLVVAGDVSRKALTEELEKTFAKACRQPLPPIYVPEEPGQLALREEHMYADVHITRGSIAYKIPGLKHPDSQSLELLAAILGNGYSSILYQELREHQNLVHHIDASCWNPGKVGLFWISYTCEPGKRAEVDKAIRAILETPEKNHITSETLEKAKRLALTAEINTLTTTGGIANKLGMSEVVAGDLDYAKQYFQNLNRRSVKELQQVMERYLQPQYSTHSSLDALSQKPQYTPRKKPAAALTDFEIIKLSNGSRLIFQRDPTLPKISIRLLGLGGAHYEYENERGITGIMATLLTRDTRYRKTPIIHDTIERVGGHFNEYVGNNSFGLSLEIIKDDWDTALSILEEGILYPQFNEASFIKERNAQIAQIKEDLDEISEQGKKILRRHFYGSHPFACDPYGRIEDLEKLTPSAIINQYQRLVNAENMVCSVAGDFDPDKLIPAIENILKQLPDYAFEKKEDNFSRPDQTGDIFESMEREQSVVYQAYPCPGIKDPDFLIAELIEEVYSDMAGPLFTRIREEDGLAYYVGAARIVAMSSGMFYLYGGTEPQSTGQVTQHFTQAMKEIFHQNIDERTLLRCQNRLKAHKRMSLQTIGSRSIRAGLNTLYGLPVNYWKGYGERLDNITLEQIHSFAQKYFRDEYRLNLTLGRNA